MVFFWLRLGQSLRWRFTPRQMKFFFYDSVTPILIFYHSGIPLWKLLVLPHQPASAVRLFTLCAPEASDVSDAELTTILRLMSSFTTALVFLRLAR